MLGSILVANRGEIAVRVLRTAKRLGLRTIAVYSEADAQAPHVRLADEAYLIGPAPASESYLLGDRILDVAKRSGAASIHPGYGFLSENADFAEGCAKAGIVFIGPPASAIRAMGLKDAAKSLVEKAGVPVVPGYHGSRQEPDFLRRKAYEIGYPVLIKAVAGGGGKGMRRVERQAEFDAALESAQREASGAFGDPRVLVEKYILSPRHIEIQVFADAHGHVVHLFERDCSLQRRHQKVIEEAPAPGMPEEVRAAMGRAAVEAARAVGYVGAGTVEFIADGRSGLKPDGFFFMEMNTRLQVEHPVTEAITGLDLVELQIRVASGEPLPFDQAALSIDGHAVEARLYAEDPESGFLPSTGKIWALRLPAEENGIRVDSGIEAGGEVTPFYDPMIAKIIAHAPTRDLALERLGQALAGTLIAGPKTNVAFLKALTEAKAFRAGHFDTGFIDRHMAELGAEAQPSDLLAAGSAGMELLLAEMARLERVRAEIAPDEARVAKPSALKDHAFTLSGSWSRGVSLLVDGERLEGEIIWDHGPRLRLGDGVEISPPPPGAELAHGCFLERTGPAVALAATDTGIIAIRNGRQTLVAWYDPASADPAEMEGDAAVKAPMHGKLVALLVKPGDVVTKGQRLAIVEAMKMEHVLTAPRDGTVHEVSGDVGAQVAQNARIVSIGDG